jgi:hypothetical protein
MLKSRNLQLGILYACIVVAFLAICYLLDIARPEWGLATTVVLFGPSHEQTTKRALARLTATAAAGASLLILDAIASSNEAAFILAAALFITGHLAIRSRQWAYYYFVFGATLAILGFDTVVMKASEELTQNFVQRLVQIGLAILVTVPPLLIYLNWNALESDDNSAEQAAEPSHFMFFLRGLFCCLGLTLLWLAGPFPSFDRVCLITAILLSASATMTTLAPMLRAGIIGLLAAFVSVVLIRLLFSVIPDHWAARTLIVSGCFGWAMARSMASKKNGMTWKIAMIVTTVLLTVEASPMADPKTYFLLVAVLLISIAVVAIGQVAANLLMSRRPLGPMP